MYILHFVYTFPYLWTCMFLFVFHFFPFFFFFFLLVLQTRLFSDYLFICFSIYLCMSFFKNCTYHYNFQSEGIPVFSFVGIAELLSKGVVLVSSHTNRI